MAIVRLASVDLVAPREHSAHIGCVFGTGAALGPKCFEAGILVSTEP
jgi:hypothetical protein